MAQERQLDFEDFLVRKAMEREARKVPPDPPSSIVAESPGLWHRLRRALHPKCSAAKATGTKKPASR
jgi:hypothetical protein